MGDQRVPEKLDSPVPSNEAPSTSKTAVDDDNLLDTSMGCDFRLHLSENEDESASDDVDTQHLEDEDPEENNVKISIDTFMLLKRLGIVKMEEAKTNKNMIKKKGMEDIILDKSNADEVVKKNIKKHMKIKLLKDGFDKITKEKVDGGGGGSGRGVKNPSINSSKIDELVVNEMLKDQVMDTQNLFEIVPRDVEEINDKYYSNMNSPQPSDKAESETNDMDMDLEKDDDNLEEEENDDDDDNDNDDDDVDDDTAKNDGCEEGILNNGNKRSNCCKSMIKTEDDMEFEEEYPLGDVFNSDIDKEYAAMIKSEIKKESDNSSEDDSLSDDSRSDVDSSDDVDSTSDNDESSDADDKESFNSTKNDDASADVAKKNKDKSNDDSNVTVQSTKRPLDDCDKTSKVKKIKLQKEIASEKQAQTEETSADKIDDVATETIITIDTIISKYMTNQSLNRLSRDDLEEIVMQKMCEEIGHKSEIIELKHQLGLQEQTMEMWRRETMQLTKQARDLEIVNRKLLHEIRLKTDREKPLMPVKITRSVGLQVRSESNMVNKAIGANKQMAKPTCVAQSTSIGPRVTTNTLISAIAPANKLLETNKIIVPTSNKVGTLTTNKSVVSIANQTAIPTVNKATISTSNKVAVSTANKVVLPTTIKAVISTVNKINLISSQVMVPALKKTSCLPKKVTTPTLNNMSVLSTDNSTCNKSTSITVLKEASTAVVNSIITPTANKPSPSVDSTSVAQRKVVSAKSPSSLLSKVLQKSTNNTTASTSLPVSTSTITVISSNSSMSTATLTPISLFKSNQNNSRPSYAKIQNTKNVIDLTDDDDNSNKTTPVALATTTTPIISQSLRVIPAQMKPTATLVQSNPNSATRIMYLCTQDPSQSGSQKLMLLNPGKGNSIIATVPGISPITMCSNQSTPVTLTAPITTVQTTPKVTAPNPTYKHPAPLPTPVQSFITGKKPIPPKPHLSIRRSEQGIVLSWKMPYVLENFMPIASYQLYAYQEVPSPPVTDLWRRIGDVRALALPMACTLTQFADGNKYYFAVRAVDTLKRVGPFSEPQEIRL